MESAQKALDALYSALNIEAVALRAEVAAFAGLDVPWHFRQIREAIAALEADGYVAN